MQHSFTAIIALVSIFLGSIVVPAHANNRVVEDAIKSRSDLSAFYTGLISTGVIHELREDKSYTVFAPTNDAFAEASPDKYPCLYSAECKEQAAEILRNHIVPGEKHLNDISRIGDIKSMFAVNGYHVIGSKLYNNGYAINGHNVLSERQLSGGILYRVDGIIANEREIARFTTSPVFMVHAPGTDLPPRVPEGTIVTIPAPGMPAHVENIQDNQGN